MQRTREADSGGLEFATRREYVEQPLGALEVGRIGAQTAKQVIVQRVRDVDLAKEPVRMGARDLLEAVGAGVVAAAAFPLVFAGVSDVPLPT